MVAGQNFVLVIHLTHNTKAQQHQHHKHCVFYRFVFHKSPFSDDLQQSTEVDSEALTTTHSTPGLGLITCVCRVDALKNFATITQPITTDANKIKAITRPPRTLMSSS
jgi:hypothetical protein